MKFHFGSRFAFAAFFSLSLIVLTIFIAENSSYLSSGQFTAAASGLSSTDTAGSSNEIFCDASRFDLNRNLPQPWSPDAAIKNQPFMIGGRQRFDESSAAARPSATTQTFDVTVSPEGQLFFQPSTVTISVGDTVRWTWDGDGHSVTGGTPCTPSNVFCSPNNTNCEGNVTSTSGTVYSRTFSQAGTFTYFCNRHCSSGMTGQVTVNPVVIHPAANDFDGDGKTDVAVYRPSTGAWYISQSSDGAFNAQLFGNSTDRIAPGDFDGDHKADLSVFRPSEGNWYQIVSTNGSFRATNFGTSTDQLDAADFDGDGKADIAVFRPSSGTWFILQSSNNAFRFQAFGTNGDVPAAGDYDGDGKADLAVFRPSVGTWFISRSSDNGFVATGFGASTDRPVPADYDGDGKTDLAVFRPTGGGWFILGSTAGFSGTAFGLSTDTPVPGDYDGDGKADIGVFRDGAWYALRSTNGSLFSQFFGATGDKPIPAGYIQ